MFELLHTVRDGVLILNPIGRMDSITAGAFTTGLAGLADLADGSSRNIVLDLSGLDYVSSAGLRVILIAAKSTKQGGSALTLCGLRGDVGQVMKISGFDEILGAHATMDAAITALAARG